VSPGSVVSFKDFTFHDGAQSDKLLIVLNSGGSKPYLVVKTTSKQKHGRKQKEGCQYLDGYYFLRAKQEPHFPIATWILFHEFYELSAAAFLQAHFRGDAEVKGVLNEQTLRAIVNCAKKTQDWSAHYDNLIS
jgi:hypothetical protein